MLRWPRAVRVEVVDDANTASSRANGVRGRQVEGQRRSRRGAVGCRMTRWWSGRVARSIGGWWRSRRQPAHRYLRFRALVAVRRQVPCCHMMAAGRRPGAGSDRRHDIAALRRQCPRCGPGGSDVFSLHLAASRRVSSGDGGCMPGCGEKRGDARRPCPVGLPTGGHAAPALGGTAKGPRSPRAVIGETKLLLATADRNLDSVSGRRDRLPARDETRRDESSGITHDLSRRSLPGRCNAHGQVI